MTEFTYFVTKGLESVEKDSRRIIKGHITAEVVDRQHEYIATDEVINIIKSYFDVFPAINDYHSNRVVGKALSYKKSEIDGHPSVYIEAEIFKKNGVSLYDTVWDKITSGEYAGFSLGGMSKSKTPIVKDDSLTMSLGDLELYEISVCPTPTNPLAVIDYVSEFAKASSLAIKKAEGGKERIQCEGVKCSFHGVVEKSGEDNNLYKQTSEVVIKDMTQEDTKPVIKAEDEKVDEEKKEEVVKSVDHSSEISLLTTMIKSHESKFDAMDTVLKGISEKLDGIQKAESKNPVEPGVTVEEKPAVSDDKDVGAPATESEKSPAPPGDAAGSIVPPAGEPQKGDDGMAKAEKISEYRTLPDGYQFKVIKAQRPSQGIPDNGFPTGYDLLKAITSGWSDAQGMRKHSSYEQSFKEGFNRVLNKEFGTGDPFTGGL